MPPTCMAAAMRSLCWGFAATWPLYGLSWGFWLRSSSWLSSLLFMRSARSQKIYKTVSHQRCSSQKKPIWMCSVDIVLFFDSSHLRVGARWLWKHSLSFQCLQSVARTASSVTWHCTEPAFNNSLCWGRLGRRTVAGGHTTSQRFHTFNINEKYDSAVLWKWTFLIINVIPGTLWYSQTDVSLTTWKHLALTTMYHGIFHYCLEPLFFFFFFKAISIIINDALMVFGWPFTVKLNFDVITCWHGSSVDGWHF